MVLTPYLDLAAIEVMDLLPVLVAFKVALYFGLFTRFKLSARSQGDVKYALLTLFSHSVVEKRRLPIFAFSTASRRQK
jgi:hypothetical protein